MTLRTVAEAADFLRFSEAGIRGLIRKGLLPVVRIGRQVRIEEGDLLALLRRDSQVRNRDLVGLSGQENDNVSFQA